MPVGVPSSPGYAIVLNLIVNISLIANLNSLKVMGNLLLKEPTKKMIEIKNEKIEIQLGLAVCPAWGCGIQFRISISIMIVEICHIWGYALGHYNV